MAASGADEDKMGTGTGLGETNRIVTFLASAELLEHLNSFNGTVNPYLLLLFFLGN
jgi:hypothetical protein